MGSQAKKYQTTKAGVERSICTSVEFSWDRSQDTIKYALQCPFIDSRPTNSEFLALMKAYFLREMDFQKKKEPPKKRLAG